MTGPAAVATASSARISSGARAQVDGVLRALAGWGLPGERRLPAVEDPAVGAELVRGAVEERLVGLLAVAVDAGELLVPAETAELAAEAHRDALLWCLRLEVELLAMLARVDEAGHEVLVLKGPALAHLDAPDPALRTFGDLDLLVRADHLDAVVAQLVAEGAARPWAERRPGYDRRFAKSVTLRRPDRVEIDLHRTLCDGAHAVRLPTDRLFAQQDRFELGGRQVPCLGPVHRLLHSSYHLVLGSTVPRLMSARDVASAVTDPGLDQEAVVAEAERWGGSAVLARAVRTSLDLLGSDAPRWSTWAAELAVPATEAAIIDRARAEGSGLGRAKIDALREAQPWSDRLAHLAALVAPSRAHLRSRGLRRRDLLRATP